MSREFARRVVKWANCTRRVVNRLSGLTNKASGRSCTKVAKAAFDLAAGAGVEDLDLHPHGAGSRFDISQRGLSSGASRVDECSNASDSGQ